MARTNRFIAGWRMDDPAPYSAAEARLMGWIVLLAMIVASAGALWALGLRGGLLTASVAALFLGASGYALQGRPTLLGAPAEKQAPGDILPLTEARHAFFGNFS